MFQSNPQKDNRECRSQKRHRMIGETQAFLNKHLRSRHHNHASRRKMRDKTDPRPQTAPIKDDPLRKNPSPVSPKIGVWLSVDMPSIAQSKAFFMSRLQNRLNRLAETSMHNDVLIDLHALSPMPCWLDDLLDEFRRRLKTQNRHVIVLANGTCVNGTYAGTPTD